MSQTRRTFVLSALVLPLVGALSCGEAAPSALAQSDRCAHCGMRIAADSPFRTGATSASGGASSFDTPKCLFRWLQSSAGSGARDIWALDYYRRERRDATTLFLVLGSDVLGPMGHDLVPVEGRERADRFSSEHHGTRVLAFSEITPAIVDPLFGGAGHHHH